MFTKDEIVYEKPSFARRIHVCLRSIVIPHDIHKLAELEKLPVLKNEIIENGGFPYRLDIYERPDGRWQIPKSRESVNWLLAAKKTHFTHLYCTVHFYKHRDRVHSTFKKSA